MSTAEIASLRRWHAGAGAAHLIQAGVLAGLMAQQVDPVKWPLDVRGWQTILTTRQYPLGALVPVFSGLSALNHGVSAAPTGYLEWSVAHRTNPLRWGEYALSAGVMLVMIGTLSGLTDVASLTSLLVSNVGLQGIGYLVEMRKADRARFVELRNLMVVGWLVFLSQWLPIFISFFSVVSTSQPRPPDVVWPIIFVMFGLFSLFGLIQIGYLCDWHWAGGGDFVAYEKRFILLSLVTKSVLNWMVWGGILAGRERFRTTS